MLAAAVSSLRAAYRLLIVLAAVLALGADRAGAVTFSQDFDSGSLNVAGTVVSGDQVTLEPRRFASPEWAGDQWWIYFKASEVAGASLTFRVPASGMFQPYQTGHRFVYSYDQADWQFFDPVGYSPDYQYYVFSNGIPFAADEVYVAYGLPYPMAVVGAHTASLRASPFVAPTASADPNLVIGRSAGGTDELGRTVPPQNLYAYRISDFSAAGPKKRVVLTAGNHAGETTANWTLQGMVDFLISDDPIAAALRQTTEFLVYPMTNPDGRYAGYFRSDPENPAKDHNRYWNAPGGFTDLAQIVSAMRTDSGGDVDCFFDFHSSGWSNSLGMVAGHPSEELSAFMEAIGQREPGVKDVFYLDAPGAAGNWAAIADGLLAELSLTPEVGFLAGQQPRRYFDLGRNYALALYDVIPEPAAGAMLMCASVGILLRRKRALAG